MENQFTKAVAVLNGGYSPRKMDRRLRKLFGKDFRHSEYADPSDIFYRNCFSGKDAGYLVPHLNTPDVKNFHKLIFSAPYEELRDDKTLDIMQDVAHKFSLESRILMTTETPVPGENAIDTHYSANPIKSPKEVLYRLTDDDEFFLILDSTSDDFSIWMDYFEIWMKIKPEISAQGLRRLQWIHDELYSAPVSQKRP